MCVCVCVCVLILGIVYSLQKRAAGCGWCHCCHAIALGVAAVHIRILIDRIRNHCHYWCSRWLVLGLVLILVLIEVSGLVLVLV